MQEETLEGYTAESRQSNEGEWEEAGGCTIEAYYPHGIEQATYSPLVKSHDVVLMALDLFEEEGCEVRVRVLKQMPDGVRICICHFPPKR